MDKTQIKEQLRKYNIKPNKLMGQNFLINENVLKEIIKAANLNKNDIVLEVGPGLGILTKELAKKAKKVMTIEKDEKIVEALREELEEYKNIEIICGDILDILGTVPSTLGTVPNYKVVANIPYYLTSHLIRTLLELENQPEEITIMIQKEVAQRICLKPPKTNLLAISVQFYGNPEIISIIPKEDFWPEPKIDSAIIKITNIKKPENVNIKKFFKLVKVGFSSPRKQLANNLSQGLNFNKEEIKKALAECNLNIQARASNLEIKDWIHLLNITNPSDHDHTNQSG
ncbi:ribosomal RNA small subunit methyltransferase A, partial [Patescibacteria group bacterium]|nr:ribosomal RNA small subunit methyltransferase A [Patescibacteria group bacterium]